MNRRHLVLAATVLLLVGCNRAPELDARSPAALKASAQKVRENVPEPNRPHYDAAMATILVATLDPMQTIEVAIRGSMPTQDSVVAQLKPVLHGLDADEVLAAAAKRSRNATEKLGQWRTQLDSLRQRHEAYQSALLRAQALTPVSADLSTVHSALPMMGDNLVQVTVTLENRLSEPVTAFSMELGLMPPSVQSPWVVEPFTSALPEPLPSGARTTVTVGPVAVNIPDVYKGEVSLEADIKITRIKTGQTAEVSVPRWSQGDELTILKLQAAITEMESMLKRIEGMQT